MEDIEENEKIIQIYIGCLTVCIRQKVKATVIQQVQNKERRIHTLSGWNIEAKAVESRLKEDHEAVYPGQNFYQDWYENGLTITSPTGGIPMIWVDRKPSNKRYGINDRQARETNGDITHRKRPRPKGVANRTASGISAYKEEELKPFLHTCQQRAGELASMYDFELGANERIYATKLCWKCLGFHYSNKLKNSPTSFDLRISCEDFKKVNEWWG